VIDDSELPPADLYRRFEETGWVRRLLELARDEDLAPETLDITSAICARPDERIEARLVAREGGTIAGLRALPLLLEVFGGGADFEARREDGSVVDAGERLGGISGSRLAVLRAERTLLNLVGRLSGVATRTARFVRIVREQAPGAPARLLDTRKTTPGLRVLEKYAVRCGGGRCHRLGLHDAVMLKDNHLAGVGDSELAAFVAGVSARARQRPGVRFVEVEVDRLAQLEALLTLDDGAVDIVLLDNMTTVQLAEAVRARGDRPVLLEASGGVSERTVGAVARTGVDRISIGALTHSAVSLDVALDVGES